MPKGSVSPSQNNEGQQLPEISNIPLRQKILEILREAILSGELKPGQPLVEMSLAAQLGVSRAPLREALQSLSKDGLVETVPYRGTTVRHLNRKDIEEIYSLRVLHERFAIKRVIEKGKKADIKELEQISLAMHKSARAKDFKTLNSEDEHFHRTLIRLADHDLLLTIWDQLSMRVRQLMSLRNQLNRDPMAVALNHPPIVEAIASRNSELACELIETHVASAADLILEEFADDLS